VDCLWPVFVAKVVCEPASTDYPEQSFAIDRIKMEGGWKGEGRKWGPIDPYSHVYAFHDTLARLYRFIVALLFLSQSRLYTKGNSCDPRRIISHLGRVKDEVSVVVQARSVSCPSRKTTKQAGCCHGAAVQPPTLLHHQPWSLACTILPTPPLIFDSHQEV